MNITPLHKLSKAEYLAIEDAIAADARGRAFLRLRDAKAQVVAADRVATMLKRALTANRLEPPREADQVRILREELNEISNYIQQTRQEIAALRPDRPGKISINSATGELGAIVSQTEEATYDILNGAERIHEAASKLPNTPEVEPLASEIEKQAIDIMTACSFQDLTGQRMTKVVNALRFIEKRVNTMIEIWGIDGTVTPTPAAEEQDTRPDAHLMNGPQADGAVSQNDIDALFSPEPEPAGPVDQNAIDRLFG